MADIVIPTELLRVVADALLVCVGIGAVPLLIGLHPKIDRRIADKLFGFSFDMMLGCGILFGLAWLVILVAEAAVA